MKNILNRCATAGLGLIAATAAIAAHAQDDSSSPLYDGAYIAPLASGVFPGESELKNTVGAQLDIGYRRDWYALEMNGAYYSVPFKSGGSVDQYGGGINGLMFPFSSSSSPLVRNLYGLLGLGLLQNDQYQSPDGRNNALTPHNFLVTTYSAGIGDMWPLSIGRYDFAIRAEAVYRYGHRADTVDRRAGDIAAPNDFNDVLVNVGLQLPLGMRQPVAAPAEEAVAVVEPVAPVDSDGDGVPDERDQCPNTPAGTQVNEVGCPLAPPPCKSPEAGQKADLSGCAVGDTVTLRGVNFDFDKATLTLNAKTILDDVAAALLAAPDIRFEIGGHTDSKGSDSYNQHLSEQRANSVMQYLGEHGVEAPRMTAAGYGETQPIADNNTDEGREINRRVELKITAGANPPAAAAASAVDASAPVEDLPPAPEAAVQ
jgi:outer membrane protein OmpA-like peptidoglycan-associated protein